MYVCISLFRVDLINNAIKTNKNRLTPHTDQKRRHDQALYKIHYNKNYMYSARFILNSGEHEVLRFIQLNI